VGGIEAYAAGGRAGWEGVIEQAEEYEERTRGAVQERGYGRTAGRCNWG
jgi:hypothetical protein